MRVTSAGAKSYIFETSLNGKTLRLTIGEVATYTIDDAQREAIAYKMQTNKGIDPRVVDAERIAGDIAKVSVIEADRLALAEVAALEQSKRQLIAANPGGAKPKIGKKTTKAAPLAALLKHPLHSITASTVQEWLEEECATRATSVAGHRCAHCTQQDCMGGRLRLRDRDLRPVQGKYRLAGGLPSSCLFLHGKCKVALDYRRPTRCRRALRAGLAACAHHAGAPRLDQRIEGRRGAVLV